MSVTARFRLPLLIPGQGQKEITHNEALLLLDAAIGTVVVRRDLASPPTDAIEGQAWLIPGNAASEWQGRSGEVAVWTAGGWRFLTMPEGSNIFVQSDGRRVRRSGETWVNDDLAGAPAAPIGSPTGGPVVDSEARAAVNSLIDRMTSLGLIRSL